MLWEGVPVPEPVPLDVDVRVAVSVVLCVRESVIELDCVCEALACCDGDAAWLRLTVCEPVAVTEAVREELGVPTDEPLEVALRVCVWLLVGVLVIEADCVELRVAVSLEVPVAEGVAVKDGVCVTVGVRVPEPEAVGVRVPEPDGLPL
jgi:hypothetical protein